MVKENKSNYVLVFGKHEMGSDVRIDFTINDAKEDRDERTSKSDLKRIIIKGLTNTNWSLMSSGVNYKLGILTGTLRGYENEEDLLKLVNRNFKNQKSNV
jgi:hypothetical protein